MNEQPLTVYLTFECAEDWHRDCGGMIEKDPDGNRRACDCYCHQRYKKRTQMDAPDDATPSTSADTD